EVFCDIDARHLGGDLLEDALDVVRDILLGVPEIEVAGTSLEIDHDDTLGLAPARGAACLAASNIRGPCRDRLHLEHRAETPAQQARPPDAENVAPRHAKLRITQVLA